MKDDNKLIAEFMGWDLYVNDGAIQLYKNGDDVKHIGQLAYVSSWDWLMPVVDKCFNLDIEVPDNLISDITHVLIDIDIENTHKAVVEFIKWYNKQ